MQDALTLSSFRKYFSSILEAEKFDVRTVQMIDDADPVVLAENPYYIIAFQAFDSWLKLTQDYEQIEAALSHIIERYPSTPKIWDTYLVLICRADLYETKEFDEFSNLVYNTRHTRKIIRTGVNDLTSVDELIRPFVQLERARIRARTRDPLATLGEKIIKTGQDEKLVNKLITVFREGGDLSSV